MKKGSLFINSARDELVVEDDFVVVLNREEFEDGRIARQYGVKTIVGGATRNHSFKAALDWASENHPDCEKVIENNAACPLTRTEWIDEMVDLLDEFDWVQTTLHLTDALGSVNDRMVNRDDYFLIQAPDAYRFRDIFACFDPAHPLRAPRRPAPAFRPRPQRLPRRRSLQGYPPL